jgi:hypothetical protein
VGRCSQNTCGRCIPCLLPLLQHAQLCIMKMDRKAALSDDTTVVTILSCAAGSCSWRPTKPSSAAQQPRHPPQVVLGPPEQLPASVWASILAVMRRVLSVRQRCKEQRHAVPAVAAAVLEQAPPAPAAAAVWQQACRTLSANPCYQQSHAVVRNSSRMVPLGGAVGGPGGSR